MELPIITIWLPSYEENPVPTVARRESILVVLYGDSDENRLCHAQISDWTNRRRDSGKFIQLQQPSEHMYCLSCSPPPSPRVGIRPVCPFNTVIKCPHVFSLYKN